MRYETDEPSVYILVKRLFVLQVVVNALVAAIPGIGNVCLVCLLLWLIFSILGVQFFKGLFYYCADPDGERAEVADTPDKATCLAKAGDGYRWVNTNINFDNTLNGLLALLQLVSTLINFVNLMLRWWREKLEGLHGDDGQQ